MPSCAKSLAQRCGVSPDSRKSKFGTTIRQNTWITIVAAVFMAMVVRRRPYSEVSFAAAALLAAYSLWTTRPWIQAAAWLSCLYSTVITAALYLTWSVAWYQLGHRPVPSVNDPKYISVAVSLLYDCTCFVLGSYDHAWRTVALLVPTALGCSVLRRRRLTVGGALLLTIPPILWVLTINLLIRDPGQVVYWFND